jgi:hypothetical protein
MQVLISGLLLIVSNAEKALLSATLGGHGTILSEAGRGLLAIGRRPQYCIATNPLDRLQGR